MSVAHGCKLKLKDVCIIRYGKDHKRLEDGAIPAYGSGGVMRHVDSWIWDKPSVLIPRKGTLGNLYYANGPFWTVDTLFWTIVDSSKVLPKYLYYLLKMKNLAALDVGTAVPSLTVDTLNEVEIDLPPLGVQGQVVELLDSIERMIEGNARLNGYLAA